MIKKPAGKVVVAPVVRISAPVASQHAALAFLLPKLQDKVRLHKTCRVGGTGERDWYYRVMELIPNEPGVIITPTTQIEIAPRYRDLESIFTLRVAHAYPRDEGRGNVRMDPSKMLNFGVDRAEYLAVWAEGSEWKIGVQVFPVSKTDVNLPILRMDQMVRQNLNLKVGDLVECQVMVKRIANQVTFRPVHEDTTLLVPPSLLKDRITYAPVTQGQVFRLTGNVRKIPPPTHPHIKPIRKMETFDIVVDATDPLGIVVIDETTDIVVEAVPRLASLPIKEESSHP